MKSLVRPYLYAGAALLALATVATAPPGAAAQSGMSHVFHALNPLLGHSNPGYLGVLVTDVDNDSVQKLKLKDNKGALITLIDHDAPAGPLLHVNDVVLSVNGENVEGAEHFGRMLKEIPAGKKVTLVITRDGAQQSITVQLVDRKAMEQDVWNKMNSQTFPPPPKGMGILTGSGDGMPGWHMPLFTSSLNVGALVEPLTAQMADYLGVPSGIMVKQIARKSEAEAAGLKPHDVILKVGGESITTSADWDRALRANEGKAVQVILLRDRKQQTITLQVDSKHHRSRAEWTDIVPQPECPEMAALDQSFGPELAELFKGDAEPLQEFSQQQLDEVRREGEELRKQFEAGKFPDVKIDPKAFEELQRQMTEFGKNFRPEDFKVDPKAMDELRNQMEQFRQNFNPDDFKISPKQMEELRHQMEQFQKEFDFDGQQLNRLELNGLKLIGPGQRA